MGKDALRGTGNEIQHLGPSFFYLEVTRSQGPHFSHEGCCLAVCFLPLVF